MVRVHNESVTIIKQRKGSNALKNTSFFYVICPGVGVMDGARCPLCNSVGSVWVNGPQSGLYSPKILSEVISFLMLVIA